MARTSPISRLVILAPVGRLEPRGDIIARFKRHTTKETKRELEKDNRKYITTLIKNSYSKKQGIDFQIWQRENYPEEIYSDRFRDQKIQYIWQNPVKKQYVLNPEDWLYSSARQRILDLPPDHLEVVLACKDWMEGH